MAATASVAGWASAAVRGAGLAGVVEVGAAAVDPPAGDVPAALPGLDRLGGDTELCGDLVEREHAVRLGVARGGRGCRGCGTAG